MQQVIDVGTKMTTLNRSLGELDVAAGLPAEIYTDPDVYELEKRLIFTREWIFVGRVSRIPNRGDYFTTTIVDEPIIVVRSNEGPINAFSSVCRHRAMTIAEGPGNCSKLFLCPYHSWTYDHEGRLVGTPGVPKERQLDKSQFGLPRLKVEVWHGFIFVNFDPNASSLHETMAPVEGLVANHRLDDLVDVEGMKFSIECNWKTYTENNCECYHCSHLHRGSHDCAPSRNTLRGTSEGGGSPLVVTRARTTHQDAAINPLGKPFFPTIPTLTDDERSHFSWITLLPGFLLILGHESVRYLVTTPTGTESIEVEGGEMFPASTLEIPRFEELRALAQLGRQRTFNEDITAVRRVQAGRHSQFAGRGPFGDLDEGVMAFSEWLIRCYNRTPLTAATPATPATPCVTGD